MVNFSPKNKCLRFSYCLFLILVGFIFDSRIFWWRFSQQSILSETGILFGGLLIISKVLPVKLKKHYLCDRIFQ